jgi:EAL and modified HD-GYP domain-containing signal transduction protein
MPSEPYFFFRPIVAADHSWAAIDWQSTSPQTTDSTELTRCFSESAAAPLASLLPMLAPLPSSAIEKSDFFAAFDEHQVIFVVPCASLDNPRLLSLCKHLRSRGYRFAVQVDNQAALRTIPLAVFDYLQFDATQARQEFSASELGFATDVGFRKIATKVGSHEMFGWLTEKTFHWSDSHFLVSHNPQNAKEPDLTRLKLLRLLNLVRQDGDTREIEGIFREEPKLSYNLLRLVNSAAVGARTRISNFSQAIALLGRRQLQRWLQMLIYADHLADGHAPNPLMQLAAARGRQMELLAAALVPPPDIDELSDNAFLIGLFSLLDVLLNLPTKEILKELPMHDAVAEALLAHGQGGILGRLLAAIIAGEAGQFSFAEAALRELGIDATMHARAQVASLHWASLININNHD